MLYVTLSLFINYYLSVKDQNIDPQPLNEEEIKALGISEVKSYSGGTVFRVQGPKKYTSGSYKPAPEVGISLKIKTKFLFSNINNPFIGKKKQKKKKRENKRKKRKRKRKKRKKSRKRKRKKIKKI